MQTVVRKANNTTPKKLVVKKAAKKDSEKKGMSLKELENAMKFAKKNKLDFSYLQ
ncbi:MAG: hypothetical protein LC122_00875 [Chitinophagales bacterium]|nr:hypothetical protein [Chitinophagales bacterium]